jgi:hypothetical protein
MMTGRARPDACLLTNGAGSSIPAAGGDRPTIPGPSCKGPACRLDTDNADHPPKLLMSTLILILSRLVGRTAYVFTTSAPRSEPQIRDNGVNRRMPRPATNSAPLLLSTLLIYGDTLRITVALHCRGRCEVNERRDSDAVDAAICEDIGEQNSCRSTDRGADCFRVCPEGESHSNDP